MKEFTKHFSYVMSKLTVWFKVSSKASRVWFLDKSNSLKTAFSGITGWSLSWEGTHSLVRCLTTSQLFPPSARIKCTTWTFLTGSQTSKYQTLYLHAMKICLDKDLKTLSINFYDFWLHLPSVSCNGLTIDSPGSATIKSAIFEISHNETMEM